MKDKELTEIVKQKGIGRYLGKCKTNLGEIEEYSAYVQIFLTNKEKYSVLLFSNPILPKYSEKLLYEGHNKNETEEIFKNIIEKDKKIKQNLASKIFNFNKN